MQVIEILSLILEGELPFLGKKDDGVIRHLIETSTLPEITQTSNDAHFPVDCSTGRVLSTQAFPQFLLQMAMVKQKIQFLESRQVTFSTHFENANIKRSTTLIRNLD